MAGLFNAHTEHCDVNTVLCWFDYFSWLSFVDCGCDNTSCMESKQLFCIASENKSYEKINKVSVEWKIFKQMQIVNLFSEGIESCKNWIIQWCSNIFSNVQTLSCF